VSTAEHISVLPGYALAAELEGVVDERTLEIIGPRIGVLYGLTEAPITCYLPRQALDGAQTGLIHSVGRVLGDYEVRLKDGEDMPLAGSGRSGEVLIRGDNVMAGYWQDDAATAASLRDGWLHTGDVGEFDEGGNLHIVGRLKDVIRSGSTSIIPKEVEDVIVQHPAVAEVAVIGLPDVEWGEAVTAFVVTKPGMSVAESDLVEHCRVRLAGYKKPRSIRFVASLPRSHYGKVLRAQLIAQTTT
jgi:acyl-CoA synthetase (AMP-forming)/AMP-acid ligase II